MKISVIIPTFKPKEYIFQCLESLKEQTLDSRLYELIIVLNGCCEPWKSSLESYIHRSFVTHKIKLIQTDIPGVSNARNIGLDNAQGQYIAFVDDDDYVSPDYLEELLLHSKPDCVALTDSIYVNDVSGEMIEDNPHHKRFNLIRDKQNPNLFESRVFFNGPCMKLIHKRIIGNRRFDIRFANGEDNLIMFNISDRVKHISFTSAKAIYYRRIRENSATTRQHGMKYEVSTSLRLMKQYILYLFKNPLGYNIKFVLSRFAAELKSILISVRK